MHATLASTASTHDLSEQTDMMISNVDAWFDELMDQEGLAALSNPPPTATHKRPAYLPTLLPFSDGASVVRLTSGQHYAR